MATQEDGEENLLPEAGVGDASESLKEDVEKDEEELVEVEEVEDSRIQEEDVVVVGDENTVDQKAGGTSTDSVDSASSSKQPSENTDPTKANSDDATNDSSSDDPSKGVSSNKTTTAATPKKVFVPSPSKPDQEAGGTAAAAAASDPASSSTSKSTTFRTYWLQLWALLIKNGWTKLRTPTATFFELLSPLFMMLVLVAAKNLTEIETRDAETYASINVDLPGPWLSLLQGFSTLGGLGVGDWNSSSLIEGAASEWSTMMNTTTTTSTGGRMRQLKEYPNEDVGNGGGGDVVEDLWDGIFAGIGDKVQSWNNKKRSDDWNNMLNDRMLQDETIDDTNGEDVISSQDIFDLLNDAQRQLARLLEGPIPVPSFGQFVGASNLLGELIGVENLPEVFTDSGFGRRWGNILTLGTIHVCPSTEPITDMFLSYLNVTYPSLVQDTLKIRVHDDEEAALQYIDQNLNERTWALIDFSKQKSMDDNIQQVDDEVHFKLRMNYTTIPNTNQITDWVAIGLNTRYQMYYLSGYLTLQRTVNEFLLSQEEDCGEELSSIGSIWSMPMPTASYNQNPFFLSVGYLLGLTMVMAFLYPTSRLVKTIVEEKETKMKETLFILGLRGWVHWLSWVITSALVFFFITITCTAALTGNVLTYSNPMYIFAYIGLFSSATVGFCFTLASLFSRAKLAAIIGPMALFATILPRFIFFSTNRYEATTGKLIASLLPSTAFAFGADIIAEYEYAETGIQEWNVNEGDYSFRTSLGFLFIDTFLYFFLGWYFEQVMPRTYGTRQPFYFLLTPKYWLSFCVAPKPSASYPNVDAIDPEDDATTTEHVDESHLHAGVRICNLYKQYHPNQEPAVKKLNLTLYESQVTSLLGSNGAGKTTTVSILTGLLRPTAGDCLLYGNSIVNDPAIARRSLGICPQHNVLFDSLTVLEHLFFFLRVKGIKPSSSDVRESALEVGLGEFLKTTSIALSGGNKRKLSVAIAFCGDPSTIVLDEPTSAMDPHSRRAIWELIREKRRGRVVLMTTHFMDEAETLSDRIAVMKEGQLQCVGSPLFLKSRFGLGYSMTLVMEGGIDKADDEDAVTTFLQEQIPGTELVRSSGKELTYRFPPGSESLFPDLFDEVEKKWNCAFGVSNSSLEEVFLELAKRKDGATKDEASKDSNITDPVKLPADSSDMESPSQRSEYLSPLAQISLLYRKRWTVQKRDGKGACFSIVVPVIVMALVLMVLMIDPRLTGPAIETSPSLYQDAIGETDIVVGSSNELITGAANESLLADDAVLYSSLLMGDSLEKSFDHVTVSVLPEEITSASASDYLLETYDDRDHHVRYGAYVIEDTLDLTFTIDWKETRSLLIGEKQRLPVDINITVQDVANLLYNLTGIGSNFRINLNTSMMQLTVRESLYDILESLPSNETALFLGEWQTAFQSAMDPGLVGAEMDANQTGVLNLPDFAEFSFDRFVMIRSYERVFGELYALLGAELTWNATPYVASAIDMLNLVNVSAVTPLLVLDGILPMLDDYFARETSSLDFHLGSLSEYLGGSAKELDGYVNFNITNISFDTETLAVRFDAVVTTGNGYLRNISFAFPQNSTEFGELVSDTDTSYTLPIRTAASVLHNASSSHAVAAFNQALLQHIHNQCSKSKTVIRSFNEPLPLTTQQEIEVKTILSILATLFLLIPFCYIPGAFVVFLVKERVSKSKHLQLVSGVNMTSYWAANYLWDLSLFFALTVLMMVVFLMFGSDTAEVFVGTTKSFFATALLFFGYGASVLPFSYMFVRNHNNPSSAQISIIGIIFITGFVAVNAYFIMSQLENTKDLAESLRPLFRMWPAYNVGEGFLNLAASYWEREILGGTNDVFDWEVAGKSLFLLYVLAPVYFILLLLLEYSQDGGAGGVVGIFLRNARRSYDRAMLHWSLARMEASGHEEVGGGTEPDICVQEEAKVVEETMDELVRTAPIVVHNLWKIYPPSTGFLCTLGSMITRAFCKSIRQCSKRSPDAPADDSSLPKPAIRGTSIAVRQGETLGLLGKNGCGKSTTLNILTGDVPLTSGEAYVAGHNIRGGRGVAEARKRIGFCPQTDPLIDLMTGRETLAMFARLRGVQEGQIDDVVQNLIDRLTLTPHADKVSAAYSGGNKRKLSLGVAALVGDGGALLVDESSSGMDPGARRHMWSLMQELAKRRSVVLTTHSMEEAAALSSRIAIMDKGRFVALGSVQQLKTKYLDGYTIDMNFTVGTLDDVIDPAVADLTESILPGCKIAERYGRFLRFNVEGVSRLGLGTTFRRLQEFKERNSCIESYSLSQCTLEQVFLKLVEENEATSK